MFRLTVLLAVLVVWPDLRHLSAATIEWAVVDGGNGHYYELSRNGVPWPEAESLAAASSYLGLPGHLATVTSQEENDFIVTNFFDPSEVNIGRVFSIGGYQPPNSPEPDENWRWVTGETWDYTNWHPWEPNGGTSENWLGYKGEIQPQWNNPPWEWNDQNDVTSTAGYIVEYSNVIPEPSTLALLVMGALGLLVYALRRR